MIEKRIVTSDKAVILNSSENPDKEPFVKHNDNKLQIIVGQKFFLNGEKYKVVDIRKDASLFFIKVSDSSNETIMNLEVLQKDIDNDPEFKIIEE